MPPIIGVIGAEIAGAFGALIAASGATAVFIGTTVFSIGTSFGLGALQKALTKPRNNASALGSGISQVRFLDWK